MSIEDAVAEAAGRLAKARTGRVLLDLDLEGGSDTQRVAVRKAHADALFVDLNLADAGIYLVLSDQVAHELACMIVRVLGVKAAKVQVAAERRAAARVPT